MKEGWIKLYRNLQDHWMWDKRVFSKFEAWVDLIWMANFEDKKFLFGNTLIEVKRGEIITSDLKLADKWNWSKCKVRAFLELLQSDEMLQIKRDKKKTTLFIKNYEKYQNTKTIKKPSKDHQETAERPSKDTIKNEKNYKNEKNEKKLFNILSATAEAGSPASIKKVGEENEEPKKERKPSSSPIHKLVGYFFSLKNWDTKNPPKRTFSGYCRPAKDLLELCENNYELAKSKLEKIREWAESRDLDWTIETVFKKWYELDFLKPKEKQPYMYSEIHNCYLRMFIGNDDKWRVIMPNGEIKFYSGLESKIIYK